MKLRRNLPLKLFAVLGALVLAYFVRSDGNARVIGLVVPVEIRNVPADKVLARSDRPQVQVTLRGPSFLLASLPSSPPVFRVSLPAEFDKRLTVTLTAEQLSLPPSVKVLGIEPSEIDLNFDSLVTREVPVVVPLIGSVEADYSLGTIEAKPARVTVRGPAAEVEKLVSVETRPLDIRGATASLSALLPVRTLGGGMVVDSPEVAVRAAVSLVLEERRFPNLPVEIRSLAPEALRLNPQQVNVAVSGPRRAVAALNREQIIPFVRVPRELSAERAVTVAVDLPDDIALVVVEPTTVIVEKARPTAATPRR